jgi:RNA recognition motif-containing protein
MRIFVGNVAFSTSEFDLEELFGRYGRVTRATIATDRVTGRSRGFGFVDMPDSTEAQAAIEALRGSTFGGRPLTVNEARPREERDNPRPARW